LDQIGIKWVGVIREGSVTQLTKPEVLFESRHDAGRKLAAELSRYSGQPVVVLAIPNGGVPVALEVAACLDAELELIVCRKIPLPLSPEGGFGAVTDDGTVVLNEEIVREYDLNREQIDFEASRVRDNVKKRSAKYKKDTLPVRMSGKTAIIVDDGMATGMTMRAAVESVRHRRPKEILVCVPISHEKTAAQIGALVNRVVTCATADLKQFFLADFYRNWRDIKDEEIIRAMEQWNSRQRS
jgi:putative phosphoribosyl transferase